MQKKVASKIFVVSAIFFLSANATALEQTVTQGIKSLDCQKEILSQLSQWGTKNEWMTLKRPFEDENSYLSPTHEIGVWVKIQFQTPHALTAYRMNTEQTEKINWDKKCQATSQIHDTKGAEEKKDPDLLSDSDLKVLIKDNPSGILFVWTPHTPCSIKGLRNIQMAAKTLGVKLFPLLHPASNRKRAWQMIRELQLPVDQLREVASLELILRGLINHAPSMIVFSKGEIKTPILRGPHSSLRYLNFVKETL